MLVTEQQLSLEPLLLIVFDRCFSPFLVTSGPAVFMLVNDNRFHYTCSPIASRSVQLIIQSLTDKQSCIRYHSALTFG